MVRERLPPGGKRCASASCRLTTAERALLVCAAALEGWPVTEFVRDAIVRRSATLLEDAAAALPPEAVIAFNRGLNMLADEAERQKAEAAASNDASPDADQIEGRL